MIARLKSYLAPEVMGDPACPFLKRWELVKTERFKLILHHFLPGVPDDRDHHDHPSSFITFVLKGGYVDDGLHKRDVVKAPAVRYRHATHTHRTRVFKGGCWTLCIFGPKIRDWGFLVEGLPDEGRIWWPWKLYRQTYGFGMTCEEEA